MNPDSRINVTAYTRWGVSLELQRHRSVMFQSYFSYSALSSQHFRPLLITPLLANSLEVQAHCLRNGELAPHPLFHVQLRNPG